MLPEQHDILWTFLTMMFTLFALYTFMSVIGHCRKREDVNSTLWGGIFGAFLLLNFWETSQMFNMVQGDQIGFFFNVQLPTVLVLLLVWGIFLKSKKIENQSAPIIRAFFFWTTVSTLLAGYTNWLPQQRSDPPPPPAAIDTSSLTMEDYVEMGRVIVMGAKQVAGQKSIGKGQCPLCHTFDPGDNIGRCPNLFGVEARSHTRIAEDRYKTSPMAVGEVEPATGVVKGAPDQVDSAYIRDGDATLTGEDYLRESLMCPSCYVVEGYGKDGDTKSPMPIINKPPISLGKVELNAVIAWLQAKDTPGEFANVTIQLPTGDDSAPTETAGGDEEAPIFVTGNESVEDMINTLGCPLCHTIPGIEGAVGELGPKLFEKVNAPARLKDPNYKGKAKTGWEYTKESILDPSAYVVFNEEANEPFPDGLMPPTFGEQMSVKALDKIVDFISQTEAPPEG